LVGTVVQILPSRFFFKKHHLPPSPSRGTVAGAGDVCSVVAPGVSIGVGIVGRSALAGGDS